MQFERGQRGRVIGRYASPGWWISKPAKATTRISCFDQGFEFS